MANRTFYPAYSYGFGRVYVEALFQCNGASNPLSTTFDGADIISTVTHTGAANNYVVTCKDAFNKVIYGSADLKISAVAGQWCTMATYTNEGTSTPLVFTILAFVAAGTAANDLSTSNTVAFSLALRNSAASGAYVK